MDSLELVRVLQFGDSTLPVGGFSFSNGLEAAIEHRIVHDVATLRRFIRTATRQAATGDGIALLVAHRGAVRGDEQSILEADRAVLNRKLNEEMRTMTVRMGKKLVELADRVVATPRLAGWLARIREGWTPGTYPVALALALAEQGVEERAAFTVHQYGVATMMLGAALRLMKLDYLDGQAMLHEVNEAVGDDYARAESASLDDMATFAPVLDILSASHVKSHVRLFMS
jgi:urease accessory protein